MNSDDSDISDMEYEAIVSVIIHRLSTKNCSNTAPRSKINFESAANTTDSPDNGACCHILIYLKKLHDENEI